MNKARLTHTSIISIDIQKILGDLVSYHKITVISWLEC